MDKLHWFLFFCFVVLLTSWIAYHSGFDNAMTLCADHAAECKALYTSEGVRGFLNAYR